jgi:carbamoylphosphate synthase large subunit
MSHIIKDIKIFHPEVFVLYSHLNEKHKPELVDHFFIEDQNIEKEDYVDYCLNIIKTYNIDIFYPNRHFTLIYNNKEIFENIGVKLIFSVSPENFKIVDNKFLCYQHIENNNLNILLPKYRIFDTKKQFLFEYKSLKNEINYTLCMKPTVAIYAAGFKIIHEEENYNQWYEMLNGRDEYDISYNTLIHLMPENKNLKQMILMELLPGDEYSIDCICQNGNIISSVIRQKHMMEEKEYQTLTYNESIFEQAKILTKEFNFNGFINMQFRDDKNGIPKFLEINPRVSGGITQCNLSGINFSDIFIKILKEEEIIQKQNFDVKVYKKLIYLK